MPPKAGGEFIFEAGKADQIDVMAGDVLALVSRQFFHLQPERNVLANVHPGNIIVLEDHRVLPARHADRNIVNSDSAGCGGSKPAAMLSKVVLPQPL